jgi:hypothetical protein
MTQATSLINHLLNGHTITRKKAKDLFDIANLTAVITRVRDKLPDGVLKTRSRKNAKGKVSLSYSIKPKDVELMYDQGLIFKISNGEYAFI